MMGCKMPLWNGQGCGGLEGNDSLMRVEDAAQRAVSMVHPAEGHPVLKRLGHGSASLLPLCFADRLGCLSGSQQDICPGDEMTWLLFAQPSEEFAS